MLKRIALVLTLAATPTAAQTNFPTPNLSYQATGVVVMCLNASGQAVPATTAGNCLGSAGSSTLTTASQWWTEANGQSVSTSGFTGTSRSSGSTAGTAAPYEWFAVQLVSSVAGTLTVTNETTPALSTTYAVQANTVMNPKIQAFGATFHASFVPSAAAIVSFADGFTAN